MQRSWMSLLPSSTNAVLSSSETRTWQLRGKLRSSNISEFWTHIPHKRYPAKTFLDKKSLTFSDSSQNTKHFIVGGNNADWRTLLSYTPWPMNEFHSDTSFEINRIAPLHSRVPTCWRNKAPSYSLLRMEKHPEVGGDTAWVSGYGLYDELSPHMQKLLEGLHAVHTSRLQYDTTIVSINNPLSVFCLVFELPQFPTPPSVKLYTDSQSGTFFTCNKVTVSTTEVINLLSSGLLRWWTPSPADWHPPSCDSHTSCYRPEISQCQSRLLHRICRAEEGRVRCAPAVPESTHSQFRRPLCQMEMAGGEHCSLGQRKTTAQSRHNWLVLTNAQRASLHRIIPGNYTTGTRRGIRTTVFGEKRKSRNSISRTSCLPEVAFYDANSEGRLQREERIHAESAK